MNGLDSEVRATSARAEPAPNGGVFAITRSIAERLLGSNAKRWLQPLLDRMRTASVASALKEQGLFDLARRLEHIEPDVDHQYTTVLLDRDFLRFKVRGQHAFQCAMAIDAIRLIDATDSPVTVVDIGDSAGTHILYLRKLLADSRLTCLSVNLDAEAIEKIRSKGLDAMLCRAEDLTRHGIEADVFMTFEMLEHLNDPVQFLRSLSYQTNCQALALTVPYVARSRAGLHQVRRNAPGPYGPETTHIFEFSPDDWALLVRHAGWRIHTSRVYRQYPCRHWLRITKAFWRATDFEGFWGAVLVRDHTWSDRYVTALSGPAPADAQ